MGGIAPVDPATMSGFDKSVRALLHERHSAESEAATSSNLTLRFGATRILTGAIASACDTPVD
jgi:hypothetical protein